MGTAGGKIAVMVAGTLLVLAAGCGHGGGSGPSLPAAGGSGTGSGTATDDTEPPTPGVTESNPAGDIPDNQVYVPFTAPGGLVEVRVPEGWARTSNAGETTFTDKLNSVRIQVVPAATAPTARSAQQDLAKIRVTAHGFTGGRVRSVTRKAGPVTLTQYQADSAPDPVTGKVVVDAVERYAFWKNGQEAIVTLSGPRGADNVDPWRTVSDSVRWLK
ncbi:hypothetical protein J4573_39435 [Actinomadura barringtoniae]|uniref:Lipoprotein n=1 Tax=Actinomadura barringtoniae TaxID=1427535 RepID=A0A939PHY2_9ACTN|nr:hypothetical protein [Actinomadura barringtoniae]MBO2453222.1 hypothetical protein [Actinomadura barringtoniae]